MQVLPCLKALVVVGLSCMGKYAPAYIALQHVSGGSQFI